MAQKIQSLETELVTIRTVNVTETDDNYETPVYGSVLSLVTMEPLLFWPALDCDYSGYSGCTAARMAAAGDSWGRGKDSPELLTSRVRSGHVSDQVGLDQVGSGEVRSSSEVGSGQVVRCQVESGRIK